MAITRRHVRVTSQHATPHHTQHTSNDYNTEDDDYLHFGGGKGGEDNWVPNVDTTPNNTHPGKGDIWLPREDHQTNYLLYSEGDKQTTKRHTDRHTQTLCEEIADSKRKKTTRKRPY